MTKERDDEGFDPPDASEWSLTPEGVGFSEPPPFRPSAKPVVCTGAGGEAAEDSCDACGEAQAVGHRMIELSAEQFTKTYFCEECAKALRDAVIAAVRLAEANGWKA